MLFIPKGKQFMQKQLKLWGSYVILISNTVIVCTYGAHSNIFDQAPEYYADSSDKSGEMTKWLKKRKMCCFRAEFLPEQG